MHPWHRWFARVWLDYALATFIGGVVLGLAAPNSSLASSDYGLLWLAALCWLPVEALLLTVFGTTPGKYLLGMTVRRADGQLLTPTEALARSASVWAVGCGLLIPLVTLFTFNAQYNRLRKGRDSSWDEKGGFIVHHEPLSTGRTALLVGAVLCLLGLVVLGTLASAPQ